MVCIQVMSSDVAVQMGGSEGNFELNAFRPILINNYLHSALILADMCDHFREFMIEGAQLNRAKIKENIEKSVMMVTALSPIIGYDQASVISHYAIDHDLTLKEAALKNGGKNVHVFEIGKVFVKGDFEHDESPELAILVTGQLETPHFVQKDVPNADFWTVKGIIEELGERSHEKSSMGSLVEFALKEGVEIELVYKARRFCKTYPKPELERLCSLRRNGSGLPLHWSHVIYLIFADDRRRRSLEKKVVADDMTASELLAEIKRRQGARSRPGSGKPLKQYDHEQLLAVLSDAGRRWIRRAKGLTANTVVELTKAEVAAIRVTLAGMVREAERLLRGKVLRNHRRAKSSSNRSRSR